MSKTNVGKYKTIYADPPWGESGGGKIKRGADRYYQLMKTKDIINMSDFVKKLANDNCHLYLWVTNNFLQDGLKVMNEWGFIYKTIITWVKVDAMELLPDMPDLFKLQRLGLGQYFRGITEQCIFGVRGTVPYKVVNGKRQQGKTVILAPRREHSVKPDEMRHMIERVSFSPYIELFARKKYNGWDSWGKEV